VRKHDSELLVMGKLWRELEALNFETRCRVLDWLMARNRETITLNYGPLNITQAKTVANQDLNQFPQFMGA
jgi:hypothetical protein